MRARLLVLLMVANSVLAGAQLTRALADRPWRNWCVSPEDEVRYLQSASSRYYGFNYEEIPRIQQALRDPHEAVLLEMRGEFGYNKFAALLCQYYLWPHPLFLQEGDRRIHSRLVLENGRIRHFGP